MTVATSSNECDTETDDSEEPVRYPPISSSRTFKKDALSSPACSPPSSCASPRRFNDKFTSNPPRRSPRLQSQPSNLAHHYLDNFEPQMESTDSEGDIEVVSLPRKRLSVSEQEKQDYEEDDTSDEIGINGQGERYVKLMDPKSGGNATRVTRKSRAVMSRPFELLSGATLMKQRFKKERVRSRNLSKSLQKEKQRSLTLLKQLERELRARSKLMRELREEKKGTIALNKSLKKARRVSASLETKLIKAKAAFLRRA